MFSFMDDDRIRPRRLPIGFNAISYEAVRRAVLVARQQGRDEARAARDVAWGLHPSLPWPLILDAAEDAQWRR
jgi:hypothetical protein